jgi:DNA-binding NarL/FixJ family response regulator
MKRILLIEDDEPVRSCFSDVLRHGGYEVISAADGREGMALFQEHAIDLVITDLFMPKQDGAETIAAIRRLFPCFKIVVVSGGGQIVGPQHLGSIVASLGVNGFLMKPFSGSRLLEEVNRVLNEIQQPSDQMNPADALPQTPEPKRVNEKA